MTLLEELKKILEANGITEYTDEQLNAFIDKAKVLVNIPNLTPHEEYDIVRDFEGDVYVTSYYPIIDDESLTLLIDDKPITPQLVNYEKGIIFLHNDYEGILTCSYKAGIAEEEINKDLLPIVAQLVQEGAGRNVSSITEGDVTVSYNITNTGVDETSLDALIRNFRAKYDTMIRWV